MNPGGPKGMPGTGGTERKVIKVFSRFGNDHGRTETGKLSSGIRNFRNPFGIGSARTQHLVIITIYNDVYSIQCFRGFQRIGKHQHFIFSFLRY